MDIKALDTYAYNVVCNWYKAIAFNPVHKGIDYSLIIRFYLWDKVGRALRLQHDIDFGELSIYKQEPTDNTYHYQPLRVEGTYKRKLLNLKKTVFIPYHTPHTAKLVKMILSKKRYGLLSKETTALIDKSNVIKSLDYGIDEVWVDALCKAVLGGLDKMGVKLSTRDAKLLAKQVTGSVAISALALEELKFYKPNALYVHSDNHPPYINYILAAKKIGIKTFTYQHGLDCEHFYYDDCFADYVAVWSKKRLQSYSGNSQFLPKKIEAIGNVFLDNILPEHIATKTENILFVTRPHSSRKCYAPSRNCLEGVAILNSILGFLSENPNLRLVVKPHPEDYVRGYEDVIDNNNFVSQVSISKETLEELIPNTLVVITEDTTAGAIAMKYGKPCVHAHFAECKPVLPFVDYRAALPGFNPKQLVESLYRILVLSKEDSKIMKEGQKRFLNDFMPVDKVENLYSFISNNM